MKKKFLKIYLLALGFSLFISSSSLNAQVVYNNDVVHSPSGSVSTTALSNFQVAAGTNRLLVVYVSWVSAVGTSINNITYNGTNLTQITTANHSNFYYETIYYLPLGTGSSTSGDVIVTLSNSSSYAIILSANTFHNVHQTMPVGNINTKISSGTSSTLSVSSDNTNDIILDAFLASSGALTSSQTTIFNNGQGISYKNANNGTNNMTWTSSASASLVHIGLEINHDGVTFLPVELTYFKGEHINSANHLKWQTASEQNNEGFLVELGITNYELGIIEWDEIGFVEGNGTTAEISNYEFIDDLNRVGFENQHGLYYRLKQIDFDGKYEYSDIINIVIEQSNDETVHIYPNPVSDVLNIEISTPTIIQITNVNGQILKELQVETNSKINIADIPAGIYFLKIGQNTQKIIIQR